MSTDPGHYVKTFRDPNTFYCFSPPVMLATFAVELLLAVFLFMRSSPTHFRKVSAVILMLLASFQLAEYQICSTTGDIPLLWSRMGFVAITLLPLAGLYLVSLVTQKQHFLKLGYATALGFAIYFILVPKSITGAICGGNYVIFNTSTDFYRLYGFYYFGFLLLGIWESLGTIACVEHTPTRSVLQWMIIGYMSFMAPMGLAYTLFPETRNAVASIMCGFAIVFAFILAFKVVPEYERVQIRR